MRINPARLVERVNQLPLLYSGYAVVSVSCYIVLLRSSLLGLFDCILDSGVGSFYDVEIDPLSSQFDHPSQGDGRSAHRTQVPRYHGIPGRHNGRRATKRSRARSPPFRGGCVRHTPPVDKKPKKKKGKHGVSDFPPKRLARYELACRRRLLLMALLGRILKSPVYLVIKSNISLYNPEFSLSVANFEYGTDTDAIQLPPRLCFWKTQLRWFLLPITRRLQECARTLQECHFYFVADSDTSSSQRRR